MGFWKSFFGGEPENPEEEKKNAEAKNFDVFKYDGVKAMRMGQFDYAERCFREAMKIKDDLEVNDYLSQTLMRLGRLDEALAEMKIMINAQPSNAALLLQAAHVAYMLEDYDEMKKLCEQALSQNSELAMANYMLAQAVLGQGVKVGSESTIARHGKGVSRFSGEHRVAFGPADELIVCVGGGGQGALCVSVVFACAFHGAARSRVGLG